MTAQDFFNKEYPECKGRIDSMFKFTPNEIMTLMTQYAESQKSAIPCVSDREKAYAFLSWREKQKVVNLGGQKHYDVKGYHVYLNDEQLFDHWDKLFHGR